MTLVELLNLGARSSQMLASAGIISRSQLEELGPVKAYLAVKQTGSKPSLNLLWAIAGALTDTRWDRLPPEFKSQLLNELQLLTSRQS
jgi:DNA transformation protein and related proteins